MLALIDGKKTYIVAFITAAVSAYTAIYAVFGWPPIPEWVFGLLASAGLGSLRDALNK